MSVSRHRKNREPLNQAADQATTVPIATSDGVNPAGRIAGAAIHDEIARRAYQLFEERGGNPGGEWDDWFRAERELRWRG